MWNPIGPEPETIWEVLHRHKDIQYSSRVSSHIARQRQIHKLRHVVSELVKRIPDEVRRDSVIQELAEYGCLTRMHVVRLLAPRLENENHTKDIDFSPSGVRLRWEAGYADTMRALDRKPWEDPCDPLEGVILHESAPQTESA
jgi:NTE family protein